MKRQHGFTVLEMIVTVAIMLILSAIATPVASSIFNQYDFTGTVERLSFEIARARMQAVGQNTNVRLRLTETGYVRETSADGVTWVAADAAVELSDGIEATAGDSGTPRFSSNGLTPASTDITVTQGSRHKTIHTNVVGRVTIS